MPGSEPMRPQYESWGITSAPSGETRPRVRRTPEQQFKSETAQRKKDLKRFVTESEEKNEMYMLRQRSLRILLDADDEKLIKMMQKIKGLHFYAKQIEHLLYNNWDTETLRLFVEKFE